MSSATSHSVSPTPKKRTRLQLDRLSKTYIEANRARLVLDEVSETFAVGEFVCLFGKSGSGKSTLLNLVSGIDAPSNGQVYIHHDEEKIALTALTERKRTLFRRRHIGTVFQFFNLIPTLTVLENVTLPLALAGGRDVDAQAIQRLEQVGLGERQNTYPDKLSGGEQQRVAIARALVHDPLLLLADEPTGNLDAETGEVVMSLLKEMSRNVGVTLLMATHAREIAHHADRVLHLVGGKLVPEDLGE